MEGSPSRPTEEERRHAARQIAEVLGDGDRMTQIEKEEFLLRSAERGYYVHDDFVSKQTYEKLFRRLALDGKTVVNVGAGFSFGKENHFLLGLSAASPKVNYVPVDARFDMSKSWHLFDSNNPETRDEVELNPVMADGRELPFADESIDGYASINLVNIPTKEYSSELFVKELLVEAARVLKRGGFILVNSFGYLYHLKDGVLVKINNDIKQENIISLQKLKSLLEEAGFTDIEPLQVEEAAVARVEQEDQKILRRDDLDISVSCHEYGGFLAFKRV